MAAPPIVSTGNAEKVPLRSKLKSAFFEYMRWTGLQLPGTMETDSSLLRPVVTGTDTVNRIVRAIELNQSVLLTGPRGCGKTWCIDEAIRVAEDRRILPRGSRVPLQGNREIPRDYLIEDQIAFVVRGGEEGANVVPARVSAPLFKHARRDVSGRPVIDGDLRQIVMDFVDKDGLRMANGRFVLFLDEINRFSDGLLDSLLSLLEERTVVMGGQEFRLPVVVCMTMNPPGYDATARRLSPPLAARIGRSFTLMTPNLDTLHHTIVDSRLRALRKQHEVNRNLATSPLPAFPDINDDIVRVACLVTLALWGNIPKGKAGSEYLTSDTRELLDALMNDGKLGVLEPMTTLASLCRFGPDGRAAADWITAAVGQSLTEAIDAGRDTAVLNERHLLTTARETLAHKIYDEFSAASHPDKTRMKEVAILEITKRILRYEPVRRSPGFSANAARAREPYSTRLDTSLALNRFISELLGEREYVRLAAEHGLREDVASSVAERLNTAWQRLTNGEATAADVQEMRALLIDPQESNGAFAKVILDRVIEGLASQIETMDGGRSGPIVRALDAGNGSATSPERQSRIKERDALTVLRGTL